MPEYLAPGVYIEETSFRAKSIEGVATSTTGFVGQCRNGPVTGTPMLVTSFEEFQRHFGSLEELLLDGVPTTNYLAHAVQLFFANGGRRLYVARIYRDGPVDPSTGTFDGRARGPGMVNIGGNETVRFRARFPGRAGNLEIQVQGLRSSNLLVGVAGRRNLNGLRPGDVVEVSSSLKTLKVIGEGTDAVDPNNVFFVRFDEDGAIRLLNAAGEYDWQQESDLATVQKVTIRVRVRTPDDGQTLQAGREDAYQGLSTHPDSLNFIGLVLRHEDPEKGIEPPTDRSARVFLEMTNPPLGEAERNQFAIQLLTDLMAATNGVHMLQNGSDGRRCTPSEYQGKGSGHDACGFVALGEVEDIAIVAAPDASTLDDRNDRQAVRNYLITHCENLQYRFAILSADVDLSDADIRRVRGEHDSKYAALYYPWLVVRNPLNSTGQSRDTLLIPPDGAIAGIYARSDIERGVHKAPANEIVRNVLRFSRNVNKGMQDVLNPEGINCLRFFEGRGYRVWGARTISSDPEWTYLNVRRLFIYLEHSIDRGTQWAVFEPNNEELWLRVRLTIESFLYEVWRTGALMGTTTEQAYFVRCDRTTMSQSDLDNGRLVCLIGVAPTKPAEFVIFRIGQWTADASII